MKKRIIITGATGFVGAHFVRHFSKNGHEVIAMGRQEKPPLGLSAFAKYIQADISEPLPITQGDVCIHCAGLATDKATYKDLYQVNVLGTKHIFEAVNAPVFIHISSASVYSLNEKILKEEDARMNEDLSDYGKTKLLAEQFLQQNYQKKQHTIILRPRAIYGTHDRVLLPRILQLMKRKAIIAPGNLKVQVSLTHIDNLIHGVEQAMKYKGASFDIFNITDELNYELRAAILALAKAIKRRIFTYLFYSCSFVENSNFFSQLPFCFFACYSTRLGLCNEINNFRYRKSQN